MVRPREFDAPYKTGMVRLRELDAPYKTYFLVDFSAGAGFAVSFFLLSPIFFCLALSFGALSPTTARSLQRW